MNLLPSGWIFALLIPVLLPLTAVAEQVLVASNAIYVVDTESGDVRPLAKLGRFVKDMTVNDTGTLGYAATSGGVFEIDLATGETTRIFGGAPARAVALAGGEVHGLFPVATGQDAKLRVFSLQDGSEVRSSAVPETTVGLRFHAAAQAVIGLEHRSRTLHRHDAGAGAKRPIVLPERQGKPGVNTLAPEVLVDERTGTLVVPELGAEAGIWVIERGLRPEWVALGHEAHFRGGVFSPDGRYLYLSALDHVAKIDLRERREVAWVGLDMVHQRIAMSADGSLLFLTVPVAGEGGALSVLSSETLLPVTRIAVPDASPYALAVVPE